MGITIKPKAGSLPNSEDCYIVSFPSGNVLLRYESKSVKGLSYDEMYMLKRFHFDCSIHYINITQSQVIVLVQDRPGSLSCHKFIWDRAYVDRMNPLHLLGKEKV